LGIGDDVGLGWMDLPRSTAPWPVFFFYSICFCSLGIGDDVGLGWMDVTLLGLGRVGLNPKP
jgi:hypothetical protein